MSVRRAWPPAATFPNAALCRLRRRACADLVCEPSFDFARASERSARAVAPFAAAPRQAPAPPDIPPPSRLRPHRRALALADAKRASGGDGAARRARRSAQSAGLRRLARRARRDRGLLRRALLCAGMGERKRPDRRGASGARATQARAATTASTCPPSPCRAILGPALIRMRSPKPKRPSLRRWSPMPSRRAGRACRRRMSRRSSSRRRASSIPASLWPKPPRRRIQPGGLPTSTRRRRATARCATN